MNNTGIAAIAPQGMQQGTPVIPQQYEPKPQGGVTGGIAPDLGGLDRRTLAMAVLGQVPGVEPAAALGRLNKLVETEKMQQAMAGQRAMAQQAQQAQQPPVAQQVLMQALNSGIGVQPQQFADGGIVGYADGGKVSLDSILATPPMYRTPEQNEILRRAGYDIQQREIGPDGNWIQRAEQFLQSPFLRQMFTSGAYKATPEELEGRTDVGATTERLYRAMGGERGQDMPPPKQPFNPATRVGTEKGRASNPNEVTYVPPIQAAPMPPKPPAPPRPGASPRAAAPVAPAAPNMLDTANQQYLETLGKSADLTPEETIRRDALRQQLEGLQKTRLSRQEKLEADLAERRAAMGQRPSGFQDPEFLLRLAAGMGGTKTLGQALTGAAGAAGEYAGQRRKEAAEAAREMRREEMDLMKLREANEDLKTALYEKDLAYASGDANAKRAADLKVAEARANMANADREFKLKQYQAESGRISAEASRTATAQRGEAASARGQLTPYQIAQIRSKAKDSITKDKNYQQRLIDASSRARKQGVVFDQEAWLNQLVDNEMQEVARAMGYELPSTGLNPPPGADQKTYDFLKIGSK